MATPQSSLASPDRPLLLAFAAVVLSFIASTVYSQHAQGFIGDDALRISGRVGPGIQHLTLARSALSRLILLLRSYSEALNTGKPPPSLAPVPSFRRDIDQHLRVYSSLIRLEGEEGLRARIQAELNSMDEALAILLPQGITSPPPADPPALRAVVDQAFFPAAQRTSAAMMLAIDLNAAHAENIARHMKIGLRRAQWMAYVLDGLCAALSGLAAWMALRASRRHGRLLSAHSRLVEERAQEMELFAGRVAHDIRGPVSATGLALEVLHRSCALDAALRPALERGRASLRRTERIISGLLDFARSGASPEKGAFCEVAEVVDDVASEVRPVAEQAHVTLHVVPFPPCAVLCGPGILTSLLSNLLNNAIKYMGDGPVRRVTVRVLPHDQVVRVEVEDSGPGMEPALLLTVFHPYVRAKDTAQPGIGLGLATVKRLAEAYGGQVGVQVRPGEGSLFWFELPRTEMSVPAQPAQLSHASVTYRR